MKKLLLVFALALVLALTSCASKRAAFVDSTMNEANSLKHLSNTRGIVTPIGTEYLIKEAEKQKAAGQTEKAFLLAEEAVLQLHLATVKAERDSLAVAYQAATDRLTATENILKTQKSAPRDAK